jgi:hypothetical protein
MTVFSAAATLHRTIKAPLGSVDTICQSLCDPPHIRVLIDPMYWHVVTGIPTNFEGIC